MEELDDAFRKMGIELTTSELKDLVEEVDADGNGLIDKEEFCDMVLTTVSFFKWRFFPLVSVEFSSSSPSLISWQWTGTFLRRSVA